VRTSASIDDSDATVRLAAELWKGWVGQCARDGRTPTVADLSRLSGVHPETLRVLFKTDTPGTRSGPGFITVARIARAIDADLATVARVTLTDGG